VSAPPLAPERPAGPAPEPAPPPAPPSSSTGRSRLRVAIALAVLVVVVLTALIVRVHWGSLVRVDAPFTFRPDRRLSMVEPGQEEVVNLPLTVRWTSEHFPITDGNHYGVFVDTDIPSPGDVVRLRICSKMAQLPPAPGEFRGVCKDQREKIFFTTEPEVTLECFEPQFHLGARRVNDHRVTVILLDKDRRRVGEAAATVPFRVDTSDARTCRGFEE
jgi:hypothetical protein